ncbi:MAG: thioredoxin family protein [Ignavibacteriales bacterium]|nr:thioredoxin family protein [Ignavibacteriales bacterium]
MKIKLWSLVFLLFVTNASSYAQFKPHTKIRLIANVASIQPGSHFTVGLLMTMDKGWHTYWINGGDAGLPTELKWTLPDGVTVDEIQWPLPEKHLDSGDILSYSYSDENMLLVNVNVAPNVALGSRVTLKVEASWLECETSCIPGSGKAELTLPVKQETPTSSHADLFKKYRQSIPPQWTPSAGFTVETKTEKGAVEFHLTPSRSNKFASIDFYPESLENVTIGRTQATLASSRLKIPLSSDQTVAKELTFRGLIVYQFEGGKQQAVAYETKLPSNAVSGGKASGGLLDQTFTTTQQGGGEQSLFLYLIFAVIGGLLLNIMPCVLPVIALKIFGIVRMAGDNPKQVKKLGWFFSLGIVASFLVLALLVIVLQLAGQQVGWGFQFQEPMFVIFMSLIVFAFGLSLFGVYEIRLPGAAVESISGAVAQQRGKGYLSSFSEGIFATILATPCTAPFLGTALGFAFSQPAWIILLIFFFVAFGMALPYLLLTSKPAWMKFLPKPGTWMENAKQFMGFLMMATLLWLLYVLGKQLGMEAVIWTGAFLLAVGVACWLIGRYATLTASRRGVITTWIVALAVVVLGYWVFLEKMLDVRNVIAGVGPSSEVSQADDSKIPWQPFSLASLESHLKSNKTVFVDFTAEWCLTCKVNEKTVLSDQRIIDKLKSGGIVTIRADWTNRNPDITKLLAKFGRSGVPLYVIFPAGKPNEPIVLPELITTSMVLEALEKAVPSTSGVLKN